MCYVNTGNDIKITLDTIYTCILLFIDLICIGLILYGLFKLSKNYRESKEASKISATRKYICRFIIDLIINIITFGYIILLINKKLTFFGEEYKFFKDIIYMVLCLIVELFFTINSELFRELMRLLTCNLVERFKKNKRNDTENLSEAEEAENDDKY